MQFSEGNLYHIYNRGNNRQTIFFNRDNYFLFLQKVHKYISPNCDMLAWCLMPNHFHFLIQANEATVRLVKEKPIAINSLTEGIRLLLSSYAKAIQVQEKFVGNLFQQKTKSKCLNDGSINYGITAFHYVHQNPWRAKLVPGIADWEFSSYRDYAGLRKGKLCNQRLAMEIFDFNESNFVDLSNGVLGDDEIKNIF